ncbi:kinase-like domain-containing protein [Rhizophagus clarus]|uniref:Kinase-like domain-containing protein n=1 Tax=Rhizophagus clarus TaxID=94130 RepID=A0A8H3KXT0_9GLOM|nr:kinase-like domain-containing protein [Rhizophagus clarus]
MSKLRKQYINRVINNAIDQLDYSVYKDFHSQHEFIRKTILDDSSLTKNEKAEAIKLRDRDYDREKLFYGSGKKRICENCSHECFATLYCEFCVQNHLKSKFSDWTSGNNKFDILIRKCQSETLGPDNIIEWVPYNNLENIVYLLEGGFSKIYTAIWVCGKYQEWDSKNQQLIRFGRHEVVLKELGNFKNVDRRWFEEVKSHLRISNKYSEIIPCYGLTREPETGNYMLVMHKMNIDLRNYLQQNQLTWKERFNITFLIIKALTPEVINGKEYTYKSDIYSVAMLMWEISSGHPPFNYYENDYNLALKIINGMRPKIIAGTPLKYKKLMVQCWNADPLERLDTTTLLKKIEEIKLYYQNNPNELSQPETEAKDDVIYISTSKIFTSNIYEFKNLPKPRNAITDDIFISSNLHSEDQVELEIPDDIDKL